MGYWSLHKIIATILVKASMPFFGGYTLDIMCVHPTEIPDFQITVIGEHSQNLSVQLHVYFAEECVCTIILRRTRPDSPTLTDRQDLERFFGSPVTCVSLTKIWPPLLIKDRV